MKIIKNRKMKVNVMFNPPTLPETGKPRGRSQIRSLFCQKLLTCRNDTGIAGDSLDRAALLGRVDQFSHRKYREHFNPISCE